MLPQGNGTDRACERCGDGRDGGSGGWPFRGVSFGVAPAVGRDGFQKRYKADAKTDSNIFLKEILSTRDVKDIIAR